MNIGNKLLQLTGRVIVMLALSVPAVPALATPFSIDATPMMVDCEMVAGHDDMSMSGEDPGTCDQGCCPDDGCSCNTACGMTGGMHGQSFIIDGMGLLIHGMTQATISRVPAEQVPVRTELPGLRPPIV